MSEKDSLNAKSSATAIPWVQLGTIGTLICAVCAVITIVQIRQRPDDSLPSVAKPSTITIGSDKTELESEKSTTHYISDSETTHVTQKEPISTDTWTEDNKICSLLKNNPLKENGYTFTASPKCVIEAEIFNQFGFDSPDNFKHSEFAVKAFNFKEN